MKIAIGSDHAGFQLKQELIGYLKGQGHEYQDFGTDSEAACDYPDFAFPVAGAVAAGQFDRGILICGSGVGMAIAANRVRGIRAVNVNNLATARQSRRHGDANILCLAGRHLAPKKALRLTEVWLKTEFSGDERHRRRIRKIDQ
ncbi:MAG: ribose 5-phosphate isomerase B [Candidatus Saganbacteria bacterium]|nr:ribose 5-phosphate isomerase B [Candidatus Saganbacteria bacterium]